MTIRRIRLTAGLVLLTYLTTHFINHALGLISLDAMEAGRVWFLALWRNPVATVLLYGSLIIHISLAFYSLYRRRHLRMPLWEALQLVLGMMIPLFLAAHIAGTRLAHELVGVKDSYSLIVLSLWNVTPANGVRQAVLVTIAWLHRLSFLAQTAPVVCACRADFLSRCGIASGARAPWLRGSRPRDLGPHGAPTGMVRTNPRGRQCAARKSARTFDSIAAAGGRNLSRYSCPGAACPRYSLCSPKTTSYSD